MPLDTVQLTRVGIRVAVSFSPLIGGGLLIEVVLRLHQRERLCEEGATAYRLVVPQTAVTAALLRAIRQVKRDAPLRLESREHKTEPLMLVLCSAPSKSPSHFHTIVLCCSEQAHAKLLDNIDLFKVAKTNSGQYDSAK